MSERLCVKERVPEVVDRLWHEAVATNKDDGQWRIEAAAATTEDMIPNSFLHTKNRQQVGSALSGNGFEPANVGLNSFLHPPPHHSLFLALSEGGSNQKKSCSVHFIAQ